MGLREVQLKDGILCAVSQTNDPAFISGPLKIRANRFTRVIVEMRVSKPGIAQLFWTSPTMSTNEPASVHATTRADGEFHQFIFEVGKNEYWGGCLTGLRFDPCGEEGVRIEIRRIALE